MSTNQLFELASAAKNCGDYGLANEIFAVLAHMAISHAADIRIGYEQDPQCDGIIENLSNPDTYGYYDLPYVIDGDGSYLCIPLPLVSRHFRNHIVWQCTRWSDREEGDHVRNHWRLSHDYERQQAAQRDLRRRFESMVDEDYRALAIRVILREPEVEEVQPAPGEDLQQWLGPATLAKLNNPKYNINEYELA